jgi:hypothetical protein
VYDVGRHFEDKSNKRNSHLTNPTANVVGLQESLPLVNIGTFGLPMVIKHTNCNQWKNGERTQFDMQELTRRTIGFSSRQFTDKQVDVTRVSTVSFTGSFPEILWSLQRSYLPVCWG